MLKRILVTTLLFSTIFVLFVTPFVHAEETSTNSGTSHTTEAERATRLKKLEEERKAFVATRETQLRVMKEQIQKSREEFKTRFQQELGKIRDERKKQIVENVGDRIVNRNTLWVAHWNEVIKRLSGILDKIQARSTEAAGKGKDVTGVNAAIVTARGAIATAQAAVDAQSKKTYVIAVTTDETLGSNVKSMISTFQSDVKTVIAALNNARRAVEGVYQAIKVVVSTSTATPSPSSSPTPTTNP